MHKIATPQQLQSKLRQIMATVAEGCSRRQIAADLRTLANGLGGRTAARNIVAPIANLNGSDPNRLAEDLEKAWRPLSEAAHALAECMPHGRDYQMNPPGDFQLARAQHTARLEAVRDIMDDLAAIGDVLADQISERARQKSYR
jgi:hypothetical protein